MSDCLVSHLFHLSKYCDLLPLPDLPHTHRAESPLSLFLPSLPHNGFPFPLLRIQHTASFVELAFPKLLQCRTCEALESKLQ